MGPNKLKKEFLLKQVLLMGALKMYFLIFSIILLYSSLYFYFVVGFSLLFLLLWLLAILFSIYPILKLLRRDITLFFDEEHLYLRDGLWLTKINKSNIKGFYSYDYSSIKHPNPPIYFQFCLYDGTKIELSDIGQADKDYLKCKKEILQNLQFTLEKELQFTASKRSNLRHLLALGPVWYEKEPI